MNDAAKIGRVAIIGAGAMGAAYAAMFSKAQDVEVAFVARGQRFDKLSQAALTVNREQYDIPVVHPDKNPDPAHLIIVALKHHHLPAALEDIRALVSDDTIILSVMNGLESEEMIGTVCGDDKLVHAIAVGIDAVREGDNFTYASPGKIIFGCIPFVAESRRVQRLQEALQSAQIPCEVPKDMMRAMWWKFMINVGINQASAVLRASYDVFQSLPDARALIVMLMREVVELAQAVKINLSNKDIDEWLRILSTLSPTGKTSMLQDIEAGRKTEVEIFSGKVVALGYEHGVPTPVNAAVLHMIKVLEQNSS